LFPGNQLQLGTISISDVHAGAYSKSNDLLLSNENYLPNKLPRACGIDYWTYYDEDDDTLTQNDITYDESKISVSCLTYMTECSWDYSSELISTSIKECSIVNGNLVDSTILATKETVYEAIEVTNEQSYSDIISKLETQDEDNNYGSFMIPESTSTSTNETSLHLPFWVYILMVIVILTIIAVLIFKKCLKPKKIIVDIAYSNQQIDIGNYNSMIYENIPLISQPF